MRGWLTPDSVPTSKTCRALFIPNDVHWIALVAGALDELTKDYNFEKFGTLEPEVVAAEFVTMFDKFSYNVETCRVIGEILWRATDVNPDAAHWLPCLGQMVNKADYPDLWATISTRFGPANATQFTLPNLGSRFPVGHTPIALPVGSAGGAYTHAITVAEMPAHSHAVNPHTHPVANQSATLASPLPNPIPVAGVAPGNTGPQSFSTLNTGGGAPMSLLPPYLAFGVFIYAK